MKTLIKLAPFLLLILLIYKSVRSCTEDEVIVSTKKYEILQEPGILFGSYRKPPKLKVLTDSGSYIIPLHRYYTKPPKLIGDEIKSVEIIENENQDVKIIFSGDSITETKNFNLKQATDSLKAEGFYEFEKYWKVHEKPISQNRAWLEFLLGAFVIGFITWKFARYFKKYMKEQKQNTEFEITLIQFCVYMLGIALLAFLFLMIFSDVPGFLD